MQQKRDTKTLMKKLIKTGTSTIRFSEMTVHICLVFVMDMEIRAIWSHKQFVIWFLFSC